MKEAEWLEFLLEKDVLRQPTVIWLSQNLFSTGDFLLIFCHEDQNMDTDEETTKGGMVQYTIFMTPSCQNKTLP